MRFIVFYVLMFKDNIISMFEILENFKISVDFKDVL